MSAAPGGARARLAGLLFGRYANDRPQRVRMLRRFIASGSSLLVICLFVVGWALGFLPRDVLVIASALVLGFVVPFDMQDLAQQLDTLTRPPLHAGAPACMGVVK